jgi:hypothetical protein
MQRILSTLFVAMLLALGFPGAAMAQSGHFVQTQTCTDQGLVLECSGKVAGLGGTTFELVVTATGTGTVECTNPGGNVAPGQTFETGVTGSSGTLETPRNGQYRYDELFTTAPQAPPDSCPNDQWSAAVTDVTFTSATIFLYEDGSTVPSDTAEVTVQ